MKRHLWKIAGGLLVVAMIYYAVKPVTKLTFYDPVIID
jgi:hypothetical protein